MEKQKQMQTNTHGQKDVINTHVTTGTQQRIKYEIFENKYTRIRFAQRVHAHMTPTFNSTCSMFHNGFTFRTISSTPFRTFVPSTVSGKERTFVLFSLVIWFAIIIIIMRVLVLFTFLSIWSLLCYFVWHIHSPNTNTPCFQLSKKKL